MNWFTRVFSPATYKCTGKRKRTAKSLSLCFDLREMPVESGLIWRRPDQDANERREACNMSRAIDIMRRVAPRAREDYLLAFERGDSLLKSHGITTPLRLAHFLAQVLHESGGLTIEWESGNYSAPRLLQIFGVGNHSAAITPSEAAELASQPMPRREELIFERVYGLGNPKKAKELGNTDHGDGYKYRGGGILQTTGRGNYRRMGQKCGVAFEEHPELVVSAEHALKPALTEWSEDDLNDDADRDDIVAITHKINGGLNGLDSRRQ